VKNAERLPRARVKDLVIRELNDETLVYDTERDKAHCLNQTAAWVWKQCDGKTTAAEAARLLQSKLDVSVDIDLIWLAVNQLERFHLVEAGTRPRLMSRRSLVLKYAAAAVALPVVMSINAPTPGQSATCLPNGSACGDTQLSCCPGLSCQSGFCRSINT
jgi:hypothetical protein